VHLLTALGAKDTSIFFDDGAGDFYGFWGIGNDLAILDVPAKIHFLIPASHYDWKKKNIQSSGRF